MNRLFLAALLCLAALATQAHTLTNEDVIWFSEGSPVSYSVQKSHDPVVDVALQMFCSDMEAVTGEKAVVKREQSSSLELPSESRLAGGKVVADSKGTICIVQLDRAKASEISKLKKLGFDIERLRTETDAFQIKVFSQESLTTKNSKQKTQNKKLKTKSPSSAATVAARPTASWN